MAEIRQAVLSVGLRSKRHAPVFSPGGEEARINCIGLEVLRHDGGDGLAICGSGDVLAGIIGGLAARGASQMTAAPWARESTATLAKCVLRRSAKSTS